MLSAEGGARVPCILALRVFECVSMSLGMWMENPRDGGAWEAAVDGVAQSRTQLKRLSSSRTENMPELS